MLQNCSSNIEKLCTPSVSVNQTCNSTTTSFNNDFKTCIKEKTNNEYCACIDVLDFNPVKDCKKTINSNFRDSNREKNACIKEGFAPCKKVIPVVLEAALTCKFSGSTTSTTATKTSQTTPSSGNCDFILFLSLSCVPLMLILHSKSTFSISKS